MSPPPIASRLADLERRIGEAARRAGRDPREVTLVAASKRQPVALLRQAIAAGQRVFGENRVQEAAAKAAELPPDLDWHLLGPLQSNKVKAAADLFSTVHSLDRVKIARALARQASARGRSLRAFLEVHLGDEETKHGFPRAGFVDAVRELAGLTGLEVVGLMAIPPFEEDPEDARRWFRRLRELRDALRREPGWERFPGLLSMGMSHDFEVAIEEGATHVRIGTDLFGPRPS